MIEGTFDPKKAIQIDDIIGLIPEGRKVVCFGAGAIAEQFCRAMSERCPILCFVDNADAMESKTICNVPVHKVDYLKTLEAGTYYVLIIGRHKDAMCQQLEDMGLVAKEDYAFIYDKLKNFVRINAFLKRCDAFEQFLLRDQDMDLNPALAPKEENKNKKYGIICFAEIIQVCIFYPITQSLMLHRLGYDVTLIVDAIPAFNSIVYFDGIEADIEKYIDYFVELIRRRYPDFKVVKLPKHSESSMTEEELLRSKQFAERSMKRYNCEKGDERFLPDNPQRESIAYDIVLDAMKCIKEFFRDNSFDVVNLQAGAHKHRWPYMWYGERMGIRMPSYDGSGGVSQNSAQGIPAQNCDIKTIVDGDYFTDDQKQKLIQWAKDSTEARRHQTVKDPGYNYQIVAADESAERTWDIVIPLNIGWDAAAVGQDRVFWSEQNWLQETLTYLMEQTDATVIVREHPAQLVKDRFLNEDHYETVPVIRQYPDRIFYCRPGDKVNTYQAIANCKVVLPFTSTTGMEAAMMGKPVIIHTKIYYRDYVDNAHDKDEYYRLIRQYLYEDRKPSYDLDKMYLSYSLLLHRNTYTNWREKKDEWLAESIPALLNRRDVQILMRNITDGIPNIYQNALDFLEEL